MHAKQFLSPSFLCIEVSSREHSHFQEQTAHHAGGAIAHVRFSTLDFSCSTGITQEPVQQISSPALQSWWHLTQRQWFGIPRMRAAKLTSQSRHHCVHPPRRHSLHWTYCKLCRLKMLMGHMKIYFCEASLENAAAKKMVSSPKIKCSLVGLLSVILGQFLLI